MVPDETVITPESFKYLAGETSRNKVPFLAASEIFVEVGALAALTPDYKDMGRQSCLLAKAIESGSQKPAEIGTAPPAVVNLILNLKTAVKIGMSVPPSAVQSASKVYQ
jgi:putative ABC transport system substrate-binding protein